MKNVKYLCLQRDVINNGRDTPFFPHIFNLRQEKIYYKWEVATPPTFWSKYASAVIGVLFLVVSTFQNFGKRTFNYGYISTVDSTF